MGHKVLGLRQRRGNLAGTFVWRFRFPVSLPPSIVLLDVIEPELASEAPFSQAHSYLSHWMLCCSLVALLALILCEGLFLPMRKGAVRGKTNQGEQGGEPKRKGSKTGVEFLGLGRREIRPRKGSWARFALVRERKGIGKLRRRENIPYVPFPKNAFGTPPLPTYDAFSTRPPICPRSVIPLEEMGADQTNPTFWGLQTAYGGCTLYHRGQNYYIPFLGGIIFGHCYRKLYTMIFLWELVTVM